MHKLVISLLGIGLLFTSIESTFAGYCIDTTFAATAAGNGADTVRSQCVTEAVDDCNCAADLQADIAQAQCQSFCNGQFGCSTYDMHYSGCDPDEVNVDSGFVCHTSQSIVFKCNCKEDL